MAAWFDPYSQAAGAFPFADLALLGTLFLGDAGTEPIAACEEFTMFFGPGDQQLAVTSATSSRAFALDAKGGIASVDSAQAPPSPFCP